jgi:hypothetical protein
MCTQMLVVCFHVGMIRATVITYVHYCNGEGEEIGKEAVMFFSTCYLVDLI